MTTQAIPQGNKQTTGRKPGDDGTWLEVWKPEETEFWQSTGELLAWRTLAVTTFNLLLAFATWFVVSAAVVKLKGVGFPLTDQQLFWIAAMPGLAAGTLRIVHTFLIPVFGTRHTVTFSTLLLLLPCAGWAAAVQNTATPYPVLLGLAFLAGLGGGNFSSFMPSTSLFFPKRLQGTALGVQAGVGNFGVSVVQFLTPWIIGLTMGGSLLGGGQTFAKPGGATQVIHLQNAFLVWMPLIVVAALLAFVFLRSVPVRATFREQADIFKEKHTWVMTALYLMTFGSFSGFAAVFPLLIKQVFGKFDGAPDPLAYAFLGPLVGAAVRVLFGPVCDRVRGSWLTQVSGVGLLACAVSAATFTAHAGMDTWGGFLWSMLGLFFFSGIGNASTFKQMPMIFPPRQAGGVIGWTSAIAAYGPFLFAVGIGAVVGAAGTPAPFFYGMAGFYALCLCLNLYFYARKGAEKPC